jgi:hypothetical protein
MKELELYIKDMNETVLNPLTWRMHHPLENGLRFIEIEKIL